MLTVKSTTCFFDLIEKMLIFQFFTFFMCARACVYEISHKRLYITKSTIVLNSQNKSCR